MASLKTHIQKLNQQQQKAVLHPQGPAVVLAGAGSGKTRVLTTRTAWLLNEQKISPEKILVVTFTNKAAAEINKRVYQLTKLKLPFSGTFHSLCCRILRQHGHYIGLNSNFVIYDDKDQLSLIKLIIKKNDFDLLKMKASGIKNIISHAKNEMLSPIEYKDIAQGDKQKLAAKIYLLYQKQLKQQQAVDFDDLLLLTVKLLTNNSSVQQSYQKQFQHVMVDEYQDTNKAQYLLSKIFSMPQQNIFVVGDFSQSIYAWRGADYRNLFYLQNDFEKISEYKLEQNYRSNQTILDAAVNVIKKNKSHPILNLWTDNQEKSKIEIYETEDAQQEAYKIFDLIKQYSYKYKYKDFAILYRTNAQSRSFEEIFIRKGIPYHLVGGTKFYQRKEIKDVLAYLRYTINPADVVSFQRIIKLGKRRLKKLQAWINSKDKDTINQTPPLELIKEILSASQYLEKYNSEDQEDKDRLQNIEELLSVASQFKSSVNFLENVSLVQDNQMPDLKQSDPSDQVTLMSLHSVKGLEFPVIFMVGMEDGLLPHSRSMYDSEQLEEERRLCYVGITRAKEKLIMTYAQKRWQYGSQSSSPPSRFLSDIPSNLTNHFHITTPSKKNKYYNKKNKFTKHYDSNRKIVIDEDSIDALLNDEIDIETFLDK